MGNLEPNPVHGDNNFFSIPLPIYSDDGMDKKKYKKHNYNRGNKRNQTFKKLSNLHIATVR
jgi:hypothetical protein